MKEKGRREEEGKAGRMNKENGRWKMEDEGRKKNDGTRVKKNVEGRK